MNKLVKEVDTTYCKYQPKETTFEWLFKTPVEDFEFNVPPDLSVIVDEYGMLEEVYEKCGLSESHKAVESHMAYALQRKIEVLEKAFDKACERLGIECEYCGNKEQWKEYFLKGEDDE